MIEPKDLSWVDENKGETPSEAGGGLQLARVTRDSHSGTKIVVATGHISPVKGLQPGRAQVVFHMVEFAKGLGMKPLLPL
jgi:hypothetical protein